ncbi:hypothetical protein AHF37_10658 [Paragonimus kellicotti]|nr:hypothetical protein AHF37_10658 [Paragonimus kellicotti]
MTLKLEAFLRVSFSYHFTMHATLHVLLYIFCAFVNAQDDWDYLMLSLRWPPTLCSFVECTAVPKPIDFVIHGLWPTTLPDEEPVHCAPAPPFDRDRLAVLLPQLNQFWPNLLSNTDAFQFCSFKRRDDVGCGCHYFVFTFSATYNTMVL